MLAAIHERWPIFDFHDGAAKNLGDLRHHRVA